MNKQQLKELERRIDEVLYFVWDPLGVSDTPATRGEYSSYVATVLKYVLEDDEGKIVEQLAKIQLESMGITTNQLKDKEVAELLLNFRDAVEEGLK